MIAHDGTAVLHRMLSLNADRFLLRNRKGLVLEMGMVLYSYFDESGKWQDRDFICLCGYLSDESSWGAFVEEWSLLCRQHKLDGIHMTNFYHEAKAKGWDDDKALQVIKEFASVVRNRILIGFSVALDSKYYRSLPKEAKGILGDPATAVLNRILRLIRNRLHSEKYDGRISICVDEEEGAVVGLYRSILRLRKSNPDLGKYIGCVCFADDNFIIPLQAADMLANLTGRWLKDRSDGIATEDVPEPLSSLLKWPNTMYDLDYEQEFWNKEALDRALGEFICVGQL